MEPISLKDLVLFKRVWSVCREGCLVSLAIIQMENVSELTERFVFIVSVLGALQVLILLRLRCCSSNF